MRKQRVKEGFGPSLTRAFRNKADKVIGFVGAFFGPYGKRHWVSAKTKTECWRKLNTAIGRSDRGVLPGPTALTADRYLTSWLTDTVKGTISHAAYDGHTRDVPTHHPRTRAAQAQGVDPWKISAVSTARWQREG